MSDGYKPRYYVSENGVGYMPSSEIVKTESFKRQLKALKRIAKKAKDNE